MTCLTYFDLPGRAEATRIALAVGGVEFEDKRVSFEEYVALRSQPNTKFPFLPILEVRQQRNNYYVVLRTTAVVFV